MPYCPSIGCGNPISPAEDFCSKCLRYNYSAKEAVEAPSLSKQYPKYYKDVRMLDELDVYAVHQVFNIQDPSGAIQHASKKLLLSGVRTGGKTKKDDIREARDTLNRWLELDAQLNPS